jgi:hypothetical protein
MRILAEVFDVRGCRILVASLLHDVLEDSDTDYDEIEAEFGVQVADAVVLLTKPKFYPRALQKKIYEAALISAQEEVLLIKLADLYDNLQTRRGCKRVLRTWKSAQRLVNGFSGRRLGPKVRRATKILRDLLADLRGEEPLASRLPAARYEEMMREAA